MIEGTSDEDRIVASFERLLRGEKRVFLHNAPRDTAGLNKLTDWQIYCLAAALDLTDACITVCRRTFDKLPRAMRVDLLHSELLSYDTQQKSRKRLDDPGYWSEFMQKYLRAKGEFSGATV